MKSEIGQACGLSSGGGLHKILVELEASGFIAPIASFGKKKKELQYRLIDEYSLIYLKWIDQAKSMALSGVDEDYWLKKAHSPAGRAWAGYAFESLCMKQVKKIKDALGISGVMSTESQWQHRPLKGDESEGAQIDLLIDRADYCINLFEIKYSDAPYLLEKKYLTELEAKKRIFLKQTETRKSLFLTLITPYGIKNKSAGFGVIDNELTMDVLFS
jgi:hypothetical protein